VPESRESAIARAKREGFPETSVMKGEKGWYIIPHGITSAKAKRAYIHCRDSGSDPNICAAMAHTLQKGNK
jgi:hypothetical protein